MSFSPRMHAWHRARRSFRNAILARFAYTLLGVTALTGYEALVFGWSFLQQFRGVFWLAIGLSFFMGAWVASRLAHRSLKFYLARETAAENVPIDDDLRREVLNLPWNLALADFVIWGVTGVVLSLPLFAGLPHQAARIFVHGPFSAMYAGQLVAMMEFYAMEWILSTGMLPFVMQGRRVSQLAGVKGTPVWLRILLLVLTASVLPMLYLFMLQAVGDSSPAILLFMIGLTILNAVWQGAHVVRSVAVPIGRLADAFERFRRSRDETEAHLSIFRADALGRFAEMFEDLAQTLRERDFIRDTFGRYVSQQVVEEILRGRVELGGTLHTATVLFADIRGFTSLSERLRPNEVVDLLNEYLEAMVQAITTHEGIPDKFIGDGVMAVWGVPMACEGHSEKAVRAALDMLGKLADINARRRAAGQQPLRIGIGIHTGELIAGNIGSKKKMEFTVIGDTVNTCSRIESANKELGTTMTISPAVYEALSYGLQVHFEKVPPLPVRGKEVPLSLYVYRAPLAHGRHGQG